MPRSYHFYQIEKFPEIESFETVEQLSLLSNENDNQETCSTRIEKKQDKFLPGVDRFAALHEYLVRLKYFARARGNQFKEFVSPYRFPIYLNSSSIDSQPLLIVCTKKEVSIDFVKRLNERAEGFKSCSLKVDFEKLRPHLKVIKGAWFREIKSANLQSTGVFGHHVDRSAEFKHAERVGQLGTLMYTHTLNQNEYTVMLTEDAGVILYDDFELEEDALKLVLDIKEKFISRFWNRES